VEPFKNIYNQHSVEHIIQLFERHGHKQARAILKKCVPEMASMELKQRVNCLKEALRDILPADPVKSFKIIHKMLAPLKNRSGLGNSAADTFALNPNGLEGFLLWPFADYVSDVGIDHVDHSLKILKEITQRFTAEFAIRPFIDQHPEHVYQQLLQWTSDESEHVRRLCSEGSRPRLPWGMKLQNAVNDPSAGIALLEKLKNDESLYVRKSVANHLNDISKDHPDLAIKIFKRWIKQAPAKEKSKIEWIVKHAGRGLIKAGHVEMLKILGVHHDAEIKLTKIKVSNNHLKIGYSLIISAVLSNQDQQKHHYILDYKLDYVRPTGKKSSKVFKGLKGQIAAEEKNLPLQFKVPFKNSSIRTLYPGDHILTLILNGKSIKSLKISLI
jgi:3-methyladenine DNA glycosylase AlkC